MSDTWDAMDYSLPGSSVHGILKARIPESVAVPSSRDLPDLGIKPMSLMCLALAGGFFTTSDTDVKFKFHFLSVKFYCNKAIPIH